MDDAQRAAAKRVILLTVFLDILGFGIILPQLAVYAAQFGATPQMAGYLSSAYSAMSFLVSPFLGALSDRIGRRPVLLISIFGTAMGYLIFGFANSLVLLFAARIIDGISAGNISTAQAYLSDITPAEDRAKTFGLFGAIFGIGFAIGPSIGTALSHLPGHFGGNLGLGLFAATLSFINFALALKSMPETLSPEIRAQNVASAKMRPIFNLHGFQKALGIPGLNIAILLGFLTTTAFATLQGTYSLFILKEYARPQVQYTIRANPEKAAQDAQKIYTEQQQTPAQLPVATSHEGAPAEDPSQYLKIPYPASLGGDFQLNAPTQSNLSWREIEKLLVRPRAAAMVSEIFTVIGFLSLIVQGGLMRTLPKKYGEVPLIITGTFIMALALILVPIPHVFWGQIAVSCLLTLGNGIATPVLTALISELAPEAERGEVIGIYQSTQSLGRIIGPIAGSNLFGLIAAGAPYVAGGMLMFVAFLIAFKLRGMGHGPAAQMAPAP
jgi:MFS family permease